MSNSESANAAHVAAAFVGRGAGLSEGANAQGNYIVECRGPDGNLKWRDEFPNVVATVGKNFMLDQALAGSGYTVVGPYIGLISSVSWSAVAAGDTMASHAGWTEAGATNAPTYTAPRKTATWAAASAGTKALSSTATFAMTGTGTVKGAFMVYGTNASTAIDNTLGTLYSAGTFSNGDKGVGNGDSLYVTYNTNL